MSNGIHTTTAQKIQALDNPRAFEFSVLKCDRGFSGAKIFYPKPHTADPYNAGWQFQIRHWHIETLEDCAKFLRAMAARTDLFIVRGLPKPDLSEFTWYRRRVKDGSKRPATLDDIALHWIVFDFDGSRVPAGMGAGDRVAAAGLHLRDRGLPAPFRGVQCVCSATASTGWKEPDTAHLRLWFLTRAPVDSSRAVRWIEQAPRLFVSTPV